MNIQSARAAILGILLLSWLLAGCKTTAERRAAKLAKKGDVEETASVSTAKDKDKGGENLAARTAPYDLGSLSTSPERNPDIYIPRGSVTGSGVTYAQVSINEPYVAMTFDDGPHATLTPRLLDLLAERNIKATFYVVGRNAREYPHIIRRMINEGHEIGNHTRTHPYLTRMSDTGVRNELNGCRDAIVAACGVAPQTMRPPYGAITSRLKSWINDEWGYPTIMWSVDPRDWQRPGSRVVADRIVAGTHNGAIILSHDIHSGTVDAMPSALDRLLSKGYKFVTITQLLELERRNGNQASQ